jgi:hypothetical protein
MQKVALGNRVFSKFSCNRVAACEIIGVEPATVIYEGDPVAFSISKNKHRRHLDKTELAFIGAKLAKLKPGGDGSNQYGKSAKFVDTKIPNASKTRIQVAKELGISPSSIDDARAVEEKGTPAIVNAVKNKKIGLQRAA